MEGTPSPVSFSLLIVEDDQSARDVIAGTIPLKFPHCTILTANNGMQGLEICQQFLPDIVVTDINLPEMDGFQMIREVGLTDADPGFIVLTAYSDKITFDKFKDLKIFAYLLKPLDFNELFSVMEKCLAGKNRGANGDGFLPP